MPPWVKILMARAARISWAHVLKCFLLILSINIKKTRQNLHEIIIYLPLTTKKHKITKITHYLLICVYSFPMYSNFPWNQVGTQLINAAKISRKPISKDRTYLEKWISPTIQPRRTGMHHSLTLGARALEAVVGIDYQMKIGHQRCDLRRESPVKKGA